MCCRIEQTAKELQLASRLSPLLNHLHDVSATDAEEEGPLMAMTGQSVSLFTIFPAPKYAKWYLISDKKPAYEMLKLALQVRIWMSGRNNRLVYIACFRMNSPAAVHWLDNRLIYAWRYPDDLRL